YAIPDPMNGEKLDRNKVNVQITHDGMVDKIGQVPDMASCAQFGGKGWYYDNPADPKSVKFCSATCTSLGSPDAGLAPAAPAPAASPGRRAVRGKDRHGHPRLVISRRARGRELP